MTLFGWYFGILEGPQRYVDRGVTEVYVAFLENWDLGFFATIFERKRPGKRRAFFPDTMEPECLAKATYPGLDVESAVLKWKGEPEKSARLFTQEFRSRGIGIEYEFIDSL